MKNKKVLIVNAWGANRGDEAQINALFRIIKKIDTNSEVYYLPFRNEDIKLDEGIKRGYKSIKRAGEYYYSVLTPILAKLGFYGRYYIIKLLFKKFLELLIKFFFFLDLNFLIKYDLIISAPQGPTIGDMDYKEKKIKILYPLSYAKKNKIPYCILGVSMGPFEDNSYKEKWVGDILSGAHKIVLREDISFENVIKKYPNLNNLSSAIDIVFSSDITDSSKFKNSCNLENLLKKYSDDFIGACISITPSRNPRNPFNKKDYIEKIVIFFDFVIKITKKNLLLFSHIGKDFQYLKKIKECSRFSDRITILEREYDSDCQQNIIQNLDFFISSRYHPTIFAIKSQTPFFCIINQFKTLGMLKKLNLLGNEVWQDDNTQKWQEGFMNAWKRKEEIKNNLKSALKKAEWLSHNYFEILYDLLK
jgi:polysaccharide pyruvyl transferase WcaK-like protein